MSRAVRYIYHDTYEDCEALAEALRSDPEIDVEIRSIRRYGYGWQMQAIW